MDNQGFCCFPYKQIFTFYSNIHQELFEIKMMFFSTISVTETWSLKIFCWMRMGVPRLLTLAFPMCLTIQICWAHFVVLHCMPHQKLSEDALTEDLRLIAGELNINISKICSKHFIFFSGHWVFFSTLLSMVLCPLMDQTLRDWSNKSPLEITMSQAPQHVILLKTQNF